MTVFTMKRLAKIANPVVAAIAVNVVNFTVRHRAVLVHPREAVLVVLLAVNHHTPIAVAVVSAGNAAFSDSVAR